MIPLTRAQVDEIIEEARVVGHRPDLSKIDLRQMDLSGVDLFATDLYGSNLYQVNLSRANLGEADCSGANLCEANLNQASLHWANLDQALMGRTILGELDLRGIKKLESVRHFGPSVLDTHTLERCQGQLPEIFLRGCGLSAWSIGLARLYQPSLASTAFTNLADQPQSPVYSACFISYTQLDQALAERLQRDLQQQGVCCWGVPEALKQEAPFQITLEQSLRPQDKLLLIVSIPAVATAWFEPEVQQVLEREVEHGQTILLPLAVDEAIRELQVGGRPLAGPRRYVADFCHWQEPDIYQAIFEQLLAHLRMAK